MTLLRIPIIPLLLFTTIGRGLSQMNGVVYQITPEEYSVLVDVYTQTGGSGWMAKTGWMDPDAPNWFGVTIEGVTCDEFGNVIKPGNVTKLQLPRNELYGPFPLSIGNLTHLIELDLTYAT